MKSPVVIKLNVRDPDLSRIREIVRAGREGKLIVFPTETVYGVGAPMGAPKISEKLTQLKQRLPGKPFSYHLGDRSMLELLRVPRTPVLRYLCRFFWPGPVTFLVLNETGEKIGVRFPNHRVTAALINAAGAPFIGTSANISGQPSPRTAQEAIDQIGEQVDYVIDCGKTEYETDSTIVDVTEKIPVVVRRAAEADEVEEAILKIALGKYPRKKILFVCTGNSCRSPMAEAWLANELRRDGKAEEMEISSCGVIARNGATATTEAILVMKNREVDLSGHRASLCTREDVLDADLIFAMSQEHYDFIAGLVPSVRDRIRVLNIPDPIGMAVPVYEEAIKGIEKKLKSMWGEIIA